MKKNILLLLIAIALPGFIYGQCDIFGVQATASDPTPDAVVTTEACDQSAITFAIPDCDVALTGAFYDAGPNDGTFDPGNTDPVDEANFPSLVAIPGIDIYASSAAGDYYIGTEYGALLNGTCSVTGALTHPGGCAVSNQTFYALVVMDIYEFNDATSTLGSYLNSYTGDAAAQPGCGQIAIGGAVDVYPTLTATDVTADAGTCGTLTVDLTAADGTVCETRTQACVNDGDTFAADFSDAFADPQACSTLTTTTAACAGCNIPVACEADAGTLTADGTAPCIAGNETAYTISATANGDINVPTDYETIYVLTSGTGFVIEATATTPSFDLVALGLPLSGTYTIHTLVAETSDNTSADFLDLSVVVPGTTTAADVIDIVTNNDICASLDPVGAPFMLMDCPCEADAGTLTADGTAPCVAGDETAYTISATANGDITVPTDYETIYVLTSGTGFVIEATATTPSFDLVALGLPLSGTYTIHTLVAETSDNTSADFLDLSVVVPGTTTAADVIDIVTNNDICASLDPVGAPFMLMDCPCEADAGTLTADGTAPCVAGDETAYTISATANGDITVPTDYETIYVLTSGTGFVIEATATTPSFDLVALGLPLSGTYTIHTLVAETSDNTSADFLDLSVVVPGTTTAADVIDIVTNNDICASLDPVGAPFMLMDCPPVLTPDISISDPCACGKDGNILVTADGVEVLFFIETVTIDIPTGATGVDIIETGNAGIFDATVDPAVATSPMFTNQGDTDMDGFDEWTATFYHAPGTGYSLMVDVEADGETTPLAIENSCTQCIDISNVPTVGEWGLIMLGLLMSIAAIVGIRQRREEEIIA